MSAAIAHYGRLGPKAEGNAQVAELLSRTVTGQHHATVAFKATLAALTAQGSAPWTGATGDLTLILKQWITLLSWERATVVADAAIAVEPALSNANFRQVEKACEEAAVLGMQSINLRAEVSQGKRPGNALLASLTLLPGSALNAPQVWASLEAVYTRVRADLALLVSLGIPPRMARVHRTLLDAYRPLASQFDYLISQWRGTSTTEVRAQLVQQATPLAQQLYTIGQQVWAPYLAGSVFIDIVRGMPLFEKLGLPFDPWILTTPEDVENRAADRISCQQLVEFWKTVGDPLAAKALQDSIAEALASESIVIESSAFKIAPWPPRYRVIHGVSVGGHQLEVGANFTLHPRMVEGKRVMEIRTIS